jgi:hypothetical protein
MLTEDVTLAECECIDPQQRWMIFKFPSHSGQLLLSRCGEMRSRLLSVVCPIITECAHIPYVANVPGLWLITLGEHCSAQFW